MLSNLCQGWEERGDFVSHCLLLAQLCQEMDTTERERTYRNSAVFVYTATITTDQENKTESTYQNSVVFVYSHRLQYPTTRANTQNIYIWHCFTHITGCLYLGHNTTLCGIYTHMFHKHTPQFSPRALLASGSGCPYIPLSSSLEPMTHMNTSVLPPTISQTTSVLCV